MASLYPYIEPYHSGFIDVGDGHQIYYEQCGNPQGQPVLFVHGGPGGGCSPDHRRFFDPEAYQITLFDQRGAGRSRPHAELQHNTTAHLIADIEQLRQQLDVESWLLFGGSWGSTLSLVYAQSYPQHVHSLILRGIFLCRQQDIDWFYQQGASEIYPDYWQDFVAPIAENERNALVTAYYARLTGADEVARMRAAEAWSIWEGRTSNLKTQQDVVAHFAHPHHALAMARIECHYFIHNAFLANNQILEQAHKLADIPCVIIHGRYDMVCPINQAFALHQAMPHSELIICSQSGHSAFEAEILNSLIHTTHRFSNQAW
ncbi:prolyl aminopeptidase [Thiomicrospira microaerophila]|uniref:prolyl aminopeptidase n=1 Tax=Thiomicrospira microaerophila TaxID=406020 RepID=UPI00200C5FE2|nr:prolyl aminopeptidase [Thiomicrospira microaerophila]UQB42387.1 prolyl aminopeptidase [Thiomicrospira microaerophila]